jgi:ubiquinone/menaquinone biosynthesis C-methylase UbiE
VSTVEIAASDKQRKALSLIERKLQDLGLSEGVRQKGFFVMRSLVRRQARVIYAGVDLSIAIRDNFCSVCGLTSDNLNQIKVEILLPLDILGRDSDEKLKMEMARGNRFTDGNSYIDILNKRGANYAVYFDGAFLFKKINNPQVQRVSAIRWFSSSQAMLQYLEEKPRPDLSLLSEVSADEAKATDITQPIQSVTNVPVVKDILSTEQPSPLAKSMIEKGYVAAGKNVLSLGSGNGNDELFFAQYGCEVLATDNNTEIITHLERKAQGVKNLSVQKLDADKPFAVKDSSVDVVYVRLLLHYLSNTSQQMMLNEINRVLKPGGVAIIQAKSKNDVLYRRGAKVDIGDGMFYFSDIKFSRNHIALSELRAKAEASGLKSIDNSEYNETLYGDNYESTLVTTICIKPESDTGVSASPESERIHATNLQDTLTYIQTQPQTQSLIVALGTSWIKGYEKGRYLQYDALNPLIGSIRTYCESRGIPFIVEEDDKLLARINAERAKEGKTGAKVVVLAGKDTVVSDEFATLRNDQEKSFVVGVDSQELTTDSYIRLMEMLTLALKLSAGLEISLDNAHITITKDNERHFYIFLPHAEPMDYEQLKMIYEVQKFA